MDAEYLKANVGDVLAEALARVAVEKPADPVEFTGHYLLRHVENHLREDKLRGQREKALEELKAEEESKAKADDERKEAESKAGETEAAEEALKEELRAADDVDPLLSRLMELVRRRTGAENAYIGRKEVVPVGGSLDGGELKPPKGPDEEGEEEGEEGDGEPQEVVEYLASTPENAFMTNHVLRAGEGVTFAAWKLPGGEDGEEEEEEAEEGAEAKKRELEPVVVDNVLRNPAVKFFRYPLLGAYAAVPIQYQSALHDEAFDAAPAEGGEAEAEGEGGEGEGEGEGKAEEAKASVPPPKTKPAELCLCVDTLGTGEGAAFGEEAVAAAKGWAKALGEALQAVELRVYEREWREEEEGKEEDAAALESATAAVQEGATAAEAAVAEAGEEAAEEVKKVAECTAKYEAAKKAVEVMKSRVAALGSRRVPPKAEALRVLRAALYLVGVRHSEMCDPHAPKRLVWERMRQRVNEGFADSMLGFDPAAESPAPHYASGSAVRQVLEGLEAGSVNSRSVALSSVLAWAQAAADLKDAAAAKRAYDEAQATAAEGGGEEGEGGDE